MIRRKSDEVTVVAPFPLKARPEKKETTAAQLIVLSGTNVGQVFPLNKSNVIIGRDEVADIQMLDAGISRRHAQIAQDRSGKYLLKDAGSRNGTFANNHQVEGSHVLQDGDKIQLGVMTILKFSYNNEPEANYAQTMYEAALRDGLTGVFNRRYFEERLAAEFGYALRHQSALALLLLDLDHFKIINDSHGHVVGDEVLQELCQLILKISRSEDVFARYGGEEFTLLCRDTDLIKASILGERIRHDVASHYFCATEKPLRLTISIGIAALPDSALINPEALLAAVDQALYQAKERGRNCIITRHPTE